ncbi:tetratricopeptide repeat protein, partial [Psychrobacter sp.]|uniref:tetratricopeptide repeat protein n=1 Tax=Psychrobacter sp. TaxID=56811 RepID=UPI003F9939BC
MPTLKQIITYKALILSLASCLILSACDTDLISNQSSTQQINGTDEYNLGTLYYTGENKNIEQDYSKAYEWLEKAAYKGHADAQNTVGLMYLKGVGTEKDRKQAIQWFQKSADQGHTEPPRDCRRLNFLREYDN